MPLEVFQAPATLREQLIEFQSRQQCYPLTELDQLKEELAGYVGIYLLYYRGQLPLYSGIRTANQHSCCMPIYIGKAENPGKRTGKGSVAGGLIGRLREHRSSIRQVNNLDIADFDFTVVAMAVATRCLGRSCADTALPTRVVQYHFWLWYPCTG